MVIGEGKKSKIKIQKSVSHEKAQKTQKIGR
jgi:hypothetical protein